MFREEYDHPSRGFLKIEELEVWFVDTLNCKVKVKVDKTRSMGTSLDNENRLKEIYSDRDIADITISAERIPNRLSMGR